jgi:hypothetical protein
LKVKKVVLHGSNLLWEKYYMAGSDNVSYLQPEIQAQLKCIHKPLQHITGTDVPFCQHPVIKFLATGSSLAAYMVGKLCALCALVCQLCGSG